MTTMTYERTDGNAASLSIGRVARAALRAAGAGALLNILVYGTARVLGVSFLIAMSPGTAPAMLAPGAVVSASVAGALLGAAVFAVLQRFGTRGLRGFQIAGLVFLALSLGGPLGVTADAATRTVLMLMHIVAGSTTIVLLSRAARL